MEQKTIAFFDGTDFEDLTLEDCQKRFGNRLPKDLIKETFLYSIDLATLVEEDFLDVAKCVELKIEIETINFALTDKYSIGYNFAEIRERMDNSILARIIKKYGADLTDTVLLAIYYLMVPDFVAVPYGIHDAKMLVKKATVDGVAITPVGVLLQPDNPRFCVSPFWLVGSNGIMVKVSNAYELLNYL